MKNTLKYDSGAGRYQKKHMLPPNVIRQLLTSVTFWVAHFSLYLKSRTHGRDLKHHGESSRHSRGVNSAGIIIGYASWSNCSLQLFASGLVFWGTNITRTGEGQIHAQAHTLPMQVLCVDTVQLRRGCSLYTIDQNTNSEKSPVAWAALSGSMRQTQPWNVYVCMVTEIDFVTEDDGA